MTKTKGDFDYEECQRKLIPKYCPYCGKKLKAKQSTPTDDSASYSCAHCHKEFNKYPTSYFMES